MTSKQHRAGLGTYQDSAGERLGRDHDAGPVFDRGHPSHFAGRGLLLLIGTLRPVRRRIVGGVVHFLRLLRDTNETIRVREQNILRIFTLHLLTASV